MRQGQQNRRGRGRGGRKPQNPLARNYESNGPDVKIRGTAAHIAEKYMSLARDALASGDMVGAESYLQHAEHYNRIIMAAQSQFGSQQGHQGDGPNGGGFRPRWNAETSDEDGDGGSDFDTTDGGGGADVRDTRGDRERQGGGGQDRERHEGNREHHGGGHERGGQQRGGGREHGRHGGNGSEGARDANGADEAEPHQSDETTPDTTVS
jgi:uncharacterized protein DUF4167